MVQEKSAKPEKKILHVGSDDPSLEVTAAPSAETIRWLSVQQGGGDGRSFEVSINVHDLKAGTMLAGSWSTRRGPGTTPCRSP